MLNLSHFFKKFQQIYQDESEKKGKIIAVIKEITKIELKKEQIVLKDGTLSITASPLVRNEIMMRKSVILDHLNTEGLKVKEIR